MNLHLARPARPFPVADRTRDGELYRTMHPRLAAIDLLREKCVDGRAGVDAYDSTVFILDALPHETVWARTCLILCGSLLDERQLERGRVRYRGSLAADVRAELGLDERPRRYVIADEPLASRGVDSGEDAILRIIHPEQPRLTLAPLEPLDEPVPVSRTAMDRAVQLAALRVDCGCGVKAGFSCGCSAGDRLASAAANGNEVH